MKKKVWFSGFITAILMVVSAFLISQRDTPTERDWSETVKPNAINAVIGDKSYRATFGKEPDALTSSRKRIVTHLEYVRHKLLQRNMDELTTQQRKNRFKQLARLKDYINRGQFPQNNAFEGQHRPNFIDRQGRICAVGYLIEQDLGRKVAESLNEKYQYEYVFNMESPKLKSWAENNGFTLRELAMIQPAYDGHSCCVIGPGQKNKISRPLESVMIGTNVGLSVINGYMGFEGSGKVIPAAAGIAMGASSITLGLANRVHYSTTDYLTGGISIAAGSWALYSVFNQKNSSRNLTIAPVPSPRFDGKMGISLNYRF